LGRQRLVIAFGLCQRHTFAERPSNTYAYRIHASKQQNKKMPSSSKSISSSSVRTLRVPRDAVVGVAVDFPTMRVAAAVVDNREAGEIVVVGVGAAAEEIRVDVGAVEEMETWAVVAPEEAEVGGRRRAGHRSDDYRKRQQQCTS
jgi:hypothetical protein